MMMVVVMVELIAMMKVMVLIKQWKYVMFMSVYVPRSVVAYETQMKPMYSFETLNTAGLSHLHIHGYI
jgi:hypothetical protein